MVDSKPLSEKPSLEPQACENILFRKKSKIIKIYKMYKRKHHKLSKIINNSILKISKTEKKSRIVKNYQKIIKYY